MAVDCCTGAVGGDAWTGTVILGLGLVSGGTWFAGGLETGLEEVVA